MAFRYTSVNATSFDDPGPMLLLEDLEAPQVAAALPCVLAECEQWIGCPTAPVIGYAPPGQIQTSVSWEEPTAVDNVAVTGVSKSALPGDIFSIVGSPHSITYTATDGSQTSFCTFQVRG